MHTLLRLPPDRIRPCSLPEVKGPAVVFPIDQYDLPFLVAGLGEQAIGCILGENYTYEAVALAGAHEHKGLAVEGLEFELDLASMYSLEGQYPLAGSLVRSADSLELVYKQGSRAFSRSARVTLITGLPPAGENVRAGFRSWSAVLQVGDSRIEVWRNSVPEPQQR